VTYKRKEVIGNATLYLGDALDVLPALATHDLILTDPPFGVGNFVQVTGNVRGGEVKWNESPPSAEVFSLMKQKSLHRIIWGAEHFNCFEGHGALIWDKNQPMEDFSKAEIASKSWGKKTEIFRHTWTNFVNTKSTNHPCERPVALYAWCLQQAPATGHVLDPFMGSAAVGVAVLKIGNSFTGIERDKDYFDVCCERIENAQRQQRMFA
jgi:16S rRNA G966 N2-methylase RsmD